MSKAASSSIPTPNFQGDSTGASSRASPLFSQLGPLFGSSGGQQASMSAPFQGATPGLFGSNGQSPGYSNFPGSQVMPGPLLDRSNAPGPSLFSDLDAQKQRWASQLQQSQGNPASASMEPSMQVGAGMGYPSLPMIAQPQSSNGGLGDAQRLNAMNQSLMQSRPADGTFFSPFGGGAISPMPNGQLPGAVGGFRGATPLGSVAQGGFLPRQPATSDQLSAMNQSLMQAQQTNGTFSPFGGSPFSLAPGAQMPGTAPAQSAMAPTAINRPIGIPPPQVAPQMPRSQDPQVYYQREGGGDR